MPQLNPEFFVSQLFWLAVFFSFLLIFLWRISLPRIANVLEKRHNKINENLILPLAKIGDDNPAIFENGVVRTPPGYKEAYQKYIEDGWTSLSCDPKYG